MSLSEFMKRNNIKIIDPIDSASNQVNSNKGTSGTNLQYDQAQGNRGKQLNPNQSKSAMPDEEDLDQGDVYWYDSSD